MPFVVQFTVGNLFCLVRMDLLFENDANNSQQLCGSYAKSLPSSATNRNQLTDDSMDGIAKKWVLLCVVQLEKTRDESCTAAAAAAIRNTHTLCFAELWESAREKGVATKMLCTENVEWHTPVAPIQIAAAAAAPLVPVLPASASTIGIGTNKNIYIQLSLVREHMNGWMNGIGWLATALPLLNALSLTHSVSVLFSSRV